MCKHSSVNCLSAPAGSQQGKFAWPRQVEADQREAAGRAHSRWFCVCICPLSLLIGNSSERPAAVQGARGVRGGGKSFPLLKRFSVAHPGRRGPFWNMARKGKGAGVSGGVPLAGVRGSAPRTLPRAFFARGIEKFFPRIVTAPRPSHTCRHRFGRAGFALRPCLAGFPPRP